MHLPEVKYRSLYKEKYIKSHYPDFYNELMNMYLDSQNYNEKLYRYMHNIDIKPICPICGNPIPYRNSPAGYGKFCSAKCMGLSEDRKKSIENTKYEKYGDKHYNNPSKATITMYERYGGRGAESPLIKEKIDNVCIDKFGIDNVFKLQEFQKRCCDTKIKKYGEPYYSNRDKSKQTCLKKYGVDNPMKSMEIQERFCNSMLNKYGCKYAMHNEDFVKKLSNSLKIAHKEGKYDESAKHMRNSKIEQLFADYLNEHNIEYLYQYRSEKYPYLCDFYIPEYDLYIEINGHWTHGKHPFNPDSEEDINILKVWQSKHTKYYDQAIYVWSQLDTKKRSIAFQNNINFLQIYSINIDVCVTMFENKINEIMYNGKENDQNIENTQI